MPRLLARGRRCRRRAVPRAFAARRLVEHPPPGEPAAPDREPRLRGHARGPSARRPPPDDGHEPRLAEPRRVAAPHARRGRERSARRDAARHLDGGGERPGFARAPRPLLGGLRDRVRGLRQGALAAVPDLAAAARAARPWAPRASRVDAPRAGARPDAALVPDPLLGPRAAFRRVPLVARRRARPDPARVARRIASQGTGTRSGSQLRARPSASHSTTTPSIRTPPSAGSKRTPIPVRIRPIARSALTPITESCGPVMPASVIAAVPPG